MRRNWHCTVLVGPPSERVPRLFPVAIQKFSLWDVIESNYQNFVSDRYEVDLAIAYFHSVRRAIFRGEWTPVAYSFGISVDMRAADSNYLFCAVTSGAITHGVVVDILSVPDLGVPYRDAEADAIGERRGAHFRVSMEKRIAGAEAVGAHKTSMLQDVEQGKSLEIEGMLGAVIELASLTEIEAPTLKALYACVSLLDQTAQTSHMKIKAVYDG